MKNKKMNIQTLEIEFLEATFERFGKFTQKWIGIDCFQFAHFSSVIAMIAVVVVCAQKVVEKDWVGLFCFAMVFLLHIYFIHHVIPSCKNECLEDMRQRRKSQQKINWHLGRVVLNIIVYFIVIDVIEVIMIPSDGFILLSKITMNTFWISYYAEIYFICCEPLPPGESKLKKGWKKLKGTISSILNPEPTVVPLPT